MSSCPRCGGELMGLATFCHVCEEYVADMRTEAEATPAPAPRAADERIPDTRLEDEIQLATRRALELLGFDVYDLSQDRATRQTPGLADLYVVGHGRCAWGEMKRPGGEQSEAQKLFERRLLANGGEYHVWTHETEAIAWARGVIGAAP